MSKNNKKTYGGRFECDTSKVSPNDIYAKKMDKKVVGEDDDDDDDDEEQQKGHEANAPHHHVRNVYGKQKKHDEDLSDVDEPDVATLLFDRKTIARLFPGVVVGKNKPHYGGEQDEDDVNLTDSDDDDGGGRGKPIDPSLFASREEANRDWGNDDPEDDDFDMQEEEEDAAHKPKPQQQQKPRQQQNDDDDDDDDDKNAECIDMPEGMELDKFITYETKDFKKLQRIGGELIKPNALEKEFLKKAMEACDAAHNAKKGGITKTGGAGAGATAEHKDNIETPFDNEEERRKFLGSCGCELCDKTRPDIPDDSTNLDSYNKMIIHDLRCVGKRSGESLIKSNAFVFNRSQAEARVKGDKSVFFVEEHEIFKHLKDHDFTNVLRPIVEAIGFARTSVMAWRRRIKCKTANGSIFYSPKNCKMTFYSMDKQIQYQKDYMQTRKYIKDNVLKEGPVDTKTTKNVRHMGGVSASGITRPGKLK